MLSKMFYLAAGLLAGAIFLRFALDGVEASRRRLSIGLMVAAFIYAAFAMAAFESTWLLIELVGVGVFGVFYFLGTRLSIRWLSLGWGLHVLWDLIPHTLFDAGFVPAWYPFVCASFDLLVAAYIWRKSEKLDAL